MANLVFEHGGNIYGVKRQEVIDFSANINPLGLPQSVKKALLSNFDRILHYPDPKARNITQKIAGYWGINERNVLLGNGSVELIYLITSTYKPKTSLIPVPTFSEYERAARCVKSKLHFLKLKEEEGFGLNLPRLAKTDITFLCNPNNPTGNLILKNRHAIENMAHKLIVIDEAFMDFLPNQKKYSFLWSAIKSRKIIVLRTLTKFFALPGLRMGYLIAHKDLINRLKQNIPPWNTNSLAQIAAELILNDKKYIKKTYTLIEKERKFLSGQLAMIEGLRPYPTVTNFILIKIEKPGLTSKHLRKSLLKKGILIRDCSNFRNLNNKYIRVAVRSHGENLKLLTNLKIIL